MGQCGCSDFQPDFKIAGPGDYTYVVSVYRSCDHCETPAGVLIYKMSPEDCDEWDVHRLPEVEISDVGTLIAVLDPKELWKQLTARGVDMEYLEPDTTIAFLNAVGKSIKDNESLIPDAECHCRSYHARTGKHAEDCPLYNGDS